MMLVEMKANAESRKKKKKKINAEKMMMNLMMVLVEAEEDLLHFCRIVTLLSLLSNLELQ
jgi:hypothetical protein